MNVLYIFAKSLKEQIRDWRFLSYSFVGPILFMVIFGLAFGGGFYTYKLSVLNLDKGTEVGGSLANYGEELKKTILEETYDEDAPIFKQVTVSSEEEAIAKIKLHEITAYVVIPQNFSRAVLSGLDENGRYHHTANVQIKGDAGSPTFGLVDSMFKGIFSRFVDEHVEHLSPVTNESEFVGVEQSTSEFDYLAPGIMLMAICFLIIQTAVILMREIESGTIIRLRLARLKTWEFLLGIGGTQILFAAFIVPVMFGTAILMGFNVSGSLLSGLLIGVAVCVSAIALGLITASFSRTSGEAFLIGNLVLVPVVFLSGVFFPIPETGFMKVWGREITLFDFQPATHAVKAFHRIFLYGGNLEDVLFELVMILVLSALFFVVGVILFKRSFFKIYL